jgi:hypothetical protein
LPEVRERIGEAPGTPPDSQTVEAVWQDALEGYLPDAPGRLREAVQLRAATAPLGALQKLVDALPTKEVDPRSAPEWLSVHGALHQALALRGSRIAVYDVRETVEAAHASLPSTFLTALHLVGDESCLAPIAAAHKRAKDDERWRQQLEAAFNAIVKRDKLSRKPVARLVRTVG